MDTFVKHFFPSHTTPGVKFALDANQRTWCFAEQHYDIHVDESFYPMNKTIRQPMTPLGLMEVNLEGMASMYGGITKQFLTPEGTISIPAISDTLKQSAGKSNAEVSQHIGVMQQFKWEDNHVALLFNMLRYTMMRKFHEARGNLNGSMGVFREGELSIDMDQWWADGYEAVCTGHEWPMVPERVTVGQRTDHRGVTVEHLKAAYPDTNTATLDLRQLSQKEALFVLIMLNKWERTSRYRLDATTDALADTVMYRGPDVTASYNDWATRTGAVVFGPVDSKTSWSALSHYVTQNRLFDQFSVALYLIAVMTYQYVPEVAEATAWLSINWEATIPQFYSVRGRYMFLNTGEAALLSQRPLNEWGYINGRLEKINLIALTFAQAFSLGIAVRGMRRCFERDPTDVLTTDDEFWNSERFIAAAASEFTRISVPMSGVSGLRLAPGKRLDEIDRERYVMTLNPEGSRLPDTHTYGEAAGTVTEAVIAPTPVADLPADYPSRAAIVEKMERLKVGNLAVRAAYPQTQFTDEEEAAMRDEVLVTTAGRVEAVMVTVHVPMLPPPGYPTYLTPSQPAPYTTPYTIADVIDKDIGKLEKSGTELELRAAWRLFAFLDLAGHRLRYRVEGKVIGAKKYVRGRHSQMLWPVYYKPETSQRPVVLKENSPEGRHAIPLPHIGSKFFAPHTIKYKGKVMRCGVSAGQGTEEYSVKEYGGSVTFIKKASEMTYDIEDSAKLVTGYLRREAQDFRFAPTAEPGVVPGANTEQGAEDVGGNA